MKKVRMTAIIICCLFFSFCFNGVVYAGVWPFDSGGPGSYPFLPKGYMIETKGGEYWLSSRFRNTVGGVLYAGTMNGLSYIDAAEAGDSLFYALIERKPTDYKYLAAYKDGVAIEDFTSYIGVPGRIQEEEYMGSNASWRIPIVGFPFEPGSFYEFAFQRGLRANNGVSMVISADGNGYLEDPFNAEEEAHYEAEKNREYEFMTSYWKVNETDGSYSWDFNLVPMRFSIQTYADLGTWQVKADEAKAFLDSVSTEDISSGRYWESNLENLRLLIEEQQQEAEEFVKEELQPKAEESMAVMVEHLLFALEQAKSSQEMIADVSILEEVLRDAKILYDKASVNTGTQMGQYSEKRVRELGESILQAETLTQTSPQTVINRTVRNLRDAMVRVLNSQVREEMIILTDEASGVRVRVPKSSVPGDTVLYVDTAQRNYDQVESWREYFQDVTEEVLFYEIGLSSGGRPIQPTEGMEIQIPEIKDIRSKAVTVYFAETGSELVRISSVRSLEYRVFTYEEAGLFALAVRPSTAGYAGPPQSVERPEADQETMNVTVVKETEIELEQEPDQTWEELTEEAGPVSELEEFDYGREWPRHDVLDSLDISLSDLRKESIPTPMVLLAAGLVLMALVVLIPEWIRKIPFILKG